jgi:hypothetical protein
MSEELRRKVHIETNIDDYRHFFSDDWAASVFQLTEHLPKIYELIFDLVMEWRSAAYTASLPVAVIEHMRAFHDGFVNTGEINTVLLRLAHDIPAKLALDVPELTHDPVLVRRLQERIVNLGAELEEARSRAQVAFPIDDTWRSYIEDSVFQLSLWGSQRICFVSIYNSYDNFLVRTLRIAISDNRCRSTDREFRSRFRDVFGAPLLEKCWTSDDVNIARLARHALSHAGGRLTDELAQQKHGFIVRDHRIQITPQKTKELFAMLKDAAFSLAEKAVTLPAFQ